MSAEHEETIQRSARFNASMQRAAAALASPLDREQVLETIVRTSIDALGAAAGAVTELTEDGEQLRVVSAVGYPIDLLARFAAIRVGDFDAVSRLVQNRSTILLASQAEFEAFAPGIASMTAAAGARAALPLATADRFLGLLVLTFATARDFDEEERELLQLLSRHCALALERARLFEQERAAREAAEHASLRLAEALERMSDLHLVFDSEWRFTLLNRAARDFLQAAGYVPELLLGRVIWEVFPRLAGDAMHAAMLRAAAEGVSVPFGTRVAFAEEGELEGSAYPLHDAVAVHARDMTQRRRAEREVERLTVALRRRVEEMETLLNVIPVGIGIATDPACEQILVNPALGDLLGIPLTGSPPDEGASGDALPFRVLHDDLEVAADEIPLLLAARTGEAVPYRDFDVVRDNGDRLTLLESAAPIFDDEGNVRGSVGAFIDITERKRAEQEARVLADASAAFAAATDVGTTFTELAQSIVPALADACSIFVVRENGSVGVAAFTATDPGTMELLRRYDAAHPVDRTPSHPVWRVMRDGQSILIPDVNDAALADSLSGEPSVLQVARESGTTSLLMVPVLARGEVLGVVIVGTRGMRRHFDRRDAALLDELARRAGLALDNARLLTREHRARQEAEEARAEAERASRSKSGFLAMMSHELRTPLNAIAGYTELIEFGLRGPVTEAQVADLQKIRRNQEHLLGLIDSVLNFARLDSGRVQYELTQVPVDAALGAVIPLIEPQLGARALSYSVTPTDPAVTVRADVEKLQQVLLNLVGNAVKFTPAGGRITLSCDVTAHEVAIHVTDTGVGIADDQLESIFEPFVQSYRTVNNMREGVGLGLAISRELARGMGGELRVVSAPGAGSTFTLSLLRGPDRAPSQ